MPYPFRAIAFYYIVALCIISGSRAMCENHEKAPKRTFFSLASAASHRLRPPLFTRSEKYLRCSSSLHSLRRTTFASQKIWFSRQVQSQEKRVPRDSLFLAPAIGFELSVSTTGFIGSLYTSLHLLTVILLYFYCKIFTRIINSNVRVFCHTTINDLSSKLVENALLYNTFQRSCAECLVISFFS